MPELQCDHNQLVCPLQNITCQCVVVETETFKQIVVWYLDSELIIVFNHLGSSQVVNANYTATVDVLENGLSSNLSFPAELQSGPLTVECVDVDFESNSRSFSIKGLYSEVFISFGLLNKTASISRNTELPEEPPLIDNVTALNSSSASLSWTPPPYNCSLNYILEIADGENVSVVSLGSIESTTTNVTTLKMGKTYNFRVASVDAAERMSNWSQPVSLAMQGLLLFSNNEISN